MSTRGGTKSCHCSLLSFFVSALGVLALWAFGFTSPLPADGGADGPRSTDLVEFDSGDFAGSGNCAWCHTALTDSSGRDVSIDKQWRSTMMANGARDPLWQAKVRSEVLRNPSVQAVIEEKCATCHTLAGTAEVRKLETAYHNSCLACHSDPPEGSVTKDKRPPTDCAECHLGDAPAKAGDTSG